MDNRITIDPKVCHGQACIRGTRILVHQILQMLANGDAIEDLLRDYPSIAREDILACFEYVALLAEEQVTPLETFGRGRKCRLRMRPEARPYVTGGRQES